MGKPPAQTGSRRITNKERWDREKWDEEYEGGVDLAGRRRGLNEAG